MLFHELQHVERRRKDLVLGPVIVDGDLDVVFLHKLFHARQRCRRRIAGNNHLDASAFAVFKLCADVIVIVLLKVDGADSVQVNAVGLVVGYSLRLSRRIHGQMVFGVLGIQAGDVQLLHPRDHLGTLEVAERIARDAQPDRRRRATGLREFGECGLNGLGQCGSGSN